MSDWTEFLMAFGAFLLAHVVPMRARPKAMLTGLFGRRLYLIGFGLISLALFYWLLMAAGRAPFVLLWPQALWQRWLVNLAMPVAILLAVFAVGARNPFGFGGTAAGFDPDHPGIAGVTRHPLMWAFAIWAAAHLTANGDLAHLLLFLPMLVFAMSGIHAAERRARRELPEFEILAARTSVWPCAALLNGRWRPVALPSLPRLFLALVIWGGILLIHPAVIGASPLP